MRSNILTSRRINSLNKTIEDHYIKVPLLVCFQNLMYRTKADRGNHILVEPLHLRSFVRLLNNPSRCFHVAIFGNGRNHLKARKLIFNDQFLGLRNIGRSKLSGETFRVL